jgi:hypothetical protein
VFSSSNNWPVDVGLKRKREEYLQRKENKLKIFIL